MVKQQALFVREREQAIHDRENVARRQEGMKRLNDQLFTQITALQITRGPPPLPEKPNATEAPSGEHSQRQKRHGQTPQLHWNNLTADRVRHNPTRGINTIKLRGRPKSSSVSKISTSLYKSESKQQKCHITADSEPSPLIHPTLPSPKAYWNMNFPRSSRF